MNPTLWNHTFKFCNTDSDISILNIHFHEWSPIGALNTKMVVTNILLNIRKDVGDGT